MQLKNFTLLLITVPAPCPMLHWNRQWNQSGENMLRSLEGICKTEDFLSQCCLFPSYCSSREKLLKVWKARRPSYWDLFLSNNRCNLVFIFFSTVIKYLILKNCTLKLSYVIEEKSCVTHLCESRRCNNVTSLKKDMAFILQKII